MVRDRVEMVRDEVGIVRDEVGIVRDEEEESKVTNVHIKRPVVHAHG